MEALTVVGGWYGGLVDSEPDLPEAQPTPQVDTPAARTSNTTKKAPTTPRRPATPRTTTARTPKPAAEADPGTGSPAGETAAKPAAPRKTTSRSTAKPAGAATQPRTTQPRPTRPKTATAATSDAATTTTPAKSTSARSTAPKGATAKSTTSPRVPAKRPPAARTTAKSTTRPKAVAQSTAEDVASGAGTQLPEATEALLLESPAPAETLSAEATPTEAATATQTETAESETTTAPKAPVRRAPSKRPAAQPRTPATKPKSSSSELATQETEPAVTTVGTAGTVETIENVEVIEVTTPVEREVVLKVTGLVKRFDDTTAVAGIDLEIVAGSFFGIVGPNGAGKTTTLSMVTGLLRPDAGSVTVHGADVWTNPVVAKRTMGVLPDRLRLFDRLTGSQLLYYSGILHGLDKKVVRSRSADLAAAFGLEESLDRLVTDYSAGMTKKVAIAAAMIHSPRLLVLDEPFESVDPVSAANVIEILQKYVAAGGTVVMSSHTMNLIERICDSVAVVVNGAILASGTMAEVRNGKTLEERFVELAGGRKAAEGMEWLHKFSD